jgi:hypothetical protein
MTAGTNETEASRNKGIAECGNVFVGSAGSGILPGPAGAEMETGRRPRIIC